MSRVINSLSSIFSQLDINFLFEKEETADECLARVNKEKAEALSKGKPYCLAAEDYRKINGL